jgi:hypothetical protein
MITPRSANSESDPDLFLKSVFTETQRCAVENLASAIIPDARIPQRVFVQEYKYTYVMDFLQLKMKNTANIFHALMQYEGSENVVIACFLQARSIYDNGDPPNWRDDLFFISPETEPDAYFTFIRRNRSEYLNRSRGSSVQPPWSVVAEILGASSDRGSWCVFGQMDADIALIGFKQRPGAFEEKIYSRFRIRRLVDALDDDPFYGVRVNERFKKWRAIMAENYL